MIDNTLLDSLLRMEEYLIHRNETGEDYDAINIEYVLRQAIDSISRIREINHHRFLNEAKANRSFEVGEYRVFHGKRKLYDYSKIQAWDAMNKALSVMLENKKDLENQLRQNFSNPDIDDSVKPTLEEKEYAYLRRRNKYGKYEDSDTEV